MFYHTQTADLGLVAPAWDWSEAELIGKNCLSRFSPENDYKP